MAASDPVSDLEHAIASAAQELAGATRRGAAPALERPREPSSATTRPTRRCCSPGRSGATPRAIAERLAERARRRLGDAASSGSRSRARASSTSFFRTRWYRRRRRGVADVGRDIGPRAPAERRQVLIEFVSANPTGPLTAAGGRHAAYGDSVARALELAATRSQREYYVNDAGGQIERFAESIAARMNGRGPARGRLRGRLRGRAGRELKAEGLGPDDLDELAATGAETMRAQPRRR